MILSIEQRLLTARGPFGIRLENLAVVRPAGDIAGRGLRTAPCSAWEDAELCPH